TGHGHLPDVRERRNCTQYRERLPVKLTVTGPAAGEKTTEAPTPPASTKPQPTTTGTPTTTPITPSSNQTKQPCAAAEGKCEELRWKAWQLESQAASARPLA